MRRFPHAAIAALVAVALCIACSRAPSGPSAEHAAAMARYEAVMAATLDPSYAHADFDAVAALLRAVPSSAREHTAAQTLAAEIEAGRARHEAQEAAAIAAARAPAAAPAPSAEEPSPSDEEPAAPIEVAAAPAEPVPAATPTPSPAAAVAAAGKRRPSGPIVLYTTAWCGYCKRAKAYLRQNNVAYVEKDIEADASNAREHQQKRSAKNLGEGVPMIDVDGEYMVGFSAPALRQMLEKQGFL